MSKLVLASRVVGGVYVVGLAAALAYALSPNANHSALFLTLVTFPWSAVVLPLLGFIAPDAPNWLALALLVMGGLANAWIVFRVPRWIGAAA